MVIVDVHVVVDAECQLGIHLFCKLRQICFVDDFEVVIEFGVYDQFDAEDLLAVDDLFQISFDLDGDTFVGLDDPCAWQ